MLEILSHKHLKNFLKYNYIDWEHIYSFGRIVSKGIQTNHNYLINSEIFLTDKWYAPLLISLFLNIEDTIFILSRDEINLLKENQLPILNKFGFDFVISNDQLVFPKHTISFTTLDNILRRNSYKGIKNQRMILKDIQNIKEDLKQIFKISLSKKDWFKSSKVLNIENKTIESKYNYFKQKFFSRSTQNINIVDLYEKDKKLLQAFFLQNSSFSQEFLKVKNAFSSDWAYWVELDYENFEWNLILEPIDEILEIKDLLKNNNFLFLSAFRKDNFFQRYLKNHNIFIDLDINFKSDFNEKNFLIYVPPRQMLPNNPLFQDLIFQQCIKLFLLKKSFTVILTNAIDLKINLATKFASKYGHLVLLESLPKTSNSILVSSFDWWIKNQYKCQLPDQIIIPLLPIPDASQPFNEQTISYYFQNSKDWFRDYLLPVTMNKLDKVVSPLRKNSGSLVILDGRVLNKQWGRELINKIQPSKVLNYIFPFK